MPFHPKVFLFHSDQFDYVLAGSGNLSRSGLSRGVEVGLVLGIDRLSTTVSDEERADIEYQFKVIYTLDNSAKSGAHIQFVKPGSAEGKEIHNILEKRVLADDDYPFKPAQVWATVARESKVTFSRNDHTKALRLYKARPTQKSSQPQNTDKKYCIYHKAHKDYTYSQAWVDFLVTQVKNPDELAKIRAVKVWNKK